MLVAEKEKARTLPLFTRLVSVILGTLPHFAKKAEGSLYADMKLYATVSSERASKGQGGNKYLEIEINYTPQKGKSTWLFPKLRVELNDGAYGAENAVLYAEEELGVWQRLYTADIKHARILKEPKGKKQKGEKVCNHSADVSCKNCNQETSQELRDNF